MRIAYGVHGYGRGHAMRALAVLPALRERHEVLILAGGDAYQALWPDYPVVRIPTFRYHYTARGRLSNYLNAKRNASAVLDLVCQGPALQMVMKTFYRSVWISDVHLSTKDARADMVYSFLNSIKVDYLYLVGDIIDVWALRKKWHWPNQYNEVVHKILKRSRKGARVFFIPGNHDEFFRQFVGMRFGQVKVVAQAVHQTADGRRLLVLHGDEFDTIVRYHLWMSHLGSWAYRYLIAVNRLVNWVRRLFGLPYYSLSGAIKRRVQAAVKHLTHFEEMVVREARREQADGVICGHTHQPAMQELDGILYCNTGDWVEHCTALVEHEDGRIELLHWPSELERREALAAAPIPTQEVAYASVN